jgi:hypothetical protein
MGTHTHTYSRLFNPALVDDVVGNAYRALATDLEHRRPNISKEIARAMDARLEILRNAWLLLLESTPSGLD